MSVVLGIAVYEVVLRRSVRRALEALRAPEEEDDDDDSPKKKQELPASIIEEMLSRHSAFFGDEGQALVRGARVLVLGLGGVGSHATIMLARAGVASLRLVDFDNVTLSSLNRHAAATLKDVGTLKTKTMANFIRSVAPFVEIDERPVMFTEATKDSLLNADFDLVLDCIDDVVTKAELVNACVRRHLPIICAMGAAGKADPTRLRVSPLADAVHDPLASKLRWKLRGCGIDYGGAEILSQTELESLSVHSDQRKAAEKKKKPAASSSENNLLDVVKADPENVLCVYSYESPRCGLLPLTEEQAQEGAANFGVVEHFRLRVLPVLGPFPALMGQAMASTALCKLAKSPIAPSPCEPLSKKIKDKLFVALKKREARRELGLKARPDDCDWIDCLGPELEFVIVEVWRARCAVTNRKLDRKPLALARWWRAKRPFGKNDLSLDDFRNNDDKNTDKALVAADELILLAPHLADALDAALDKAASDNRTSPDDLFQAAARALGGEEYATRIDNRLRRMRIAAGGGSWWD